jgi:phosphocarrier protein HPr
VKIAGALLIQQDFLYKLYEYEKKNLERNKNNMSCNGVNCASYCDGCHDLKHSNEVREFTVHFEKITDVKDFVMQAEKLSSKIAIISHNNYICDAKSLMGVFGLDLSQPVKITTTDEDDYDVLFNFCVTRGIAT